jgi:DNA-binding IclR family transcriptional regulator
MLSLLPRTQIRALYPHRDDLISRHGNGPATLAELDALLADAKANGWSRENGEITPEYASVGASARDHNDYPVAGVGITFREDALEASSWAELGKATTATADLLTARLVGRV